MEWAQEVSAKALVGMPSGRVDEPSWEAFHTAFIAAIGQAAEAKLPMILDMAGIEYMSSRGLRVLTLARREAEQKAVALTLARPNARMREIFSISRYDKIFTITEGLEG